MANHDIKQAAKKAGVALWRVAEVLGIGENTMTRRLRHELPAEEKTRILEIIEELAKGA